MKKTAGLLLITLALIQSGCLHLYQPFITEKDLVSEKRISGTWTSGNRKIKIEEYGQSRIKKEINQNERKSSGLPAPEQIRDSVIQNHMTYILSYPDQHYMYYYVMQVTRSGSSLYAQIMPFIFAPVKNGEPVFDEKEFPDSRYNSLTGMEVAGSWALAKIRFENNNRMSLNFIDSEKIRELILNGRMKIPYAYDRLYDNFLVTAESSELKALIAKYGDNENLYNKQFSFDLLKSR